MNENRIVIAARFRGPPASGNGGYTCGLLGRLFDGAAEVRLERPPPLDVPLEVVADGDAQQLQHEGVVVAVAGPAVLDLPVPAAPTPSEAEAACEHYIGFDTHPFPTCFVCGPERDLGDGLRIFAGRLADDDRVAAPWRPHASLAAADGQVAVEHVWAALDCPSYFALALAGRPALLGTLRAHVHRRPNVDETCIVSAWPLTSRGRVHTSGCALQDASGALMASAHATWIEIKGRMGD